MLWLVGLTFGLKLKLLRSGVGVYDNLVFAFVLQQIVGKMGGETMSHLNSSSGSVEPTLYYPGQKRPGEDGVGNQLPAMGHQRVMTEEYKVPDRMVGFIIGRGGEQITRIQLESGCKIQIASDSGGLMERPCSLTGTPECIE
ncbi:Far upstream element-binding protein 3 [Ilyodon furcidens]|uniref:Far upstream element-binding protein 3 n=1 Tax=Ilyodon furcidens TaxID=33524 RepID=A0ABV0U756_9TELE